MAIGMQAGQLFYRMEVRDSALSTAKVKRFGDTFQKMGARLTTVARTVGIAVAAIGASMLLSSRHLVNLASAAEEQGAKFDTVFKEEANAARIFADQLGQSVGRSKYELIQFLAAMQDTFVPLGFARGEARKLSQQMVKLAIDVASFNNASDAEVLRNFQSAIVGNHEAVRSYGIIITEADLKQELFRMGIKKSYQEMTALEKVQGRLSLITKGTTDAQGDAVRTAGSYANRVRALQGRLHELGTEIGMRLLPAATRLAESFLRMAPAIGRWGDAFADAFEQLFGGVDKAKQKIQELKTAVEAVEDANRRIHQLPSDASASQRINLEKQRLASLRKLRTAAANEVGARFNERMRQEEAGIRGKERLELGRSISGYEGMFQQEMKRLAEQRVKARLKAIEPFDKAIKAQLRLIADLEDDARKEKENEEKEAAVRAQKRRDAEVAAIEQSIQRTRRARQAELMREARDVEMAFRREARSISEYLYDPIKRQALEINEQADRLSRTYTAQSDAALRQLIERERDRRIRELAESTQAKNQIMPSFVGLREAHRALTLQLNAPKKDASERTAEYTAKELAEVKAIRALTVDQLRADMTLPERIATAILTAGVGTLGP